MFREELTWTFIGAVALAYIAHRHNHRDQKQVKLSVPPSAQTEVDPTRWRHDGTQNTMYKDGNRRPNDETFETESSLFETLAF